MSTSFQDKTLVCIDCFAEFEFTADQQREFAERGFTREPRRCRSCREKRKDVKPAETARGGHRAPRGDAAQRGPRGPRRPLEFHPAVCVACGRKTQVPFKPAEGRPVYCRECHELRKRAAKE
ncbi:MAG: zinc-ribbon domain containing protein [Phycisphaerae bacterium]|nr:zinc-ribbon domain containing protein [Phycisphaerae bacterium]